MCENDEAIIMVNGLSLSLRCLKAEDAHDLALIINNKKVQDNMLARLPLPYTEIHAKGLITTLASKKHLTYVFAIVYSGKTIGIVGVNRKLRVRRPTAEIGCFLAEHYWGKGIMTEAVRWMCSFVFGNTDITNVFAKTFSQNIASCRVLEKAGFQIESILPQNAAKNGQLMDMTIYTIVKPVE